MKVFIIALLALVVIGGGLAVWGVGVSNKEIDLSIKFEAQEKVMGAFYSKMFVILKQQAGVADQYKESFGSIYKDLIAGRYSGEGQPLMKWIQESNPNFDTSLYNKLMASIEGQRNGFHIEQVKMIDIAATHKSLRLRFPTSTIVGSRDELVYVPILASEAKKVIETREETAEDLELF